MTTDPSGQRPADRDGQRDDMVTLGQVSGLFGVHGWVKVFSHARPRESIVEFERWLLRARSGPWQEFRVLEGRRQGNGVVARLEGIDDRDAAGELLRCEIAVPRRDMPPARTGEYYWIDLIGLRVETLDGVDLGRVVDLVETGANDVLVVRGDRERLLPFVQEQFVRSIDLDSGRMTVDWDPDF